MPKINFKVALNPGLVVYTRFWEIEAEGSKLQGLHGYFGDCLRKAKTKNKTKLKNNGFEHSFSTMARTLR